MKKLLTLLVTIASINGYSQCENNLLTNGSFDGTPGNSTMAPGWTASNSTPDLNDDSGTLNCTPGYTWSGTVQASSDGGSWQNIVTTESFMQTVTASQGSIYTLCFEYALQGIFSGAQYYEDPNSLNILINGTILDSTDVDSTLNTWESACYTFQAPSDVVEIKFELNNPALLSYMAVDGACLTLDSGQGFSSVRADKSVRFYPSPLEDNSTLAFSNPNADRFTLEIFNHLGTVVKRISNISSDRVLIEKEGMQSGVYYYTLSSRVKQEYSGKFIVQ